MPLKKLVVGSVLVASLAACAGRDPAPVMRSRCRPITNWTATALYAGISGNTAKIASLQGEESNKRGQSIAMGIVGGLLFWPALFAMDFKDAAEDGPQGCRGAPVMPQHAFLRPEAVRRPGARRRLGGSRPYAVSSPPRRRHPWCGRHRARCNRPTSPSWPPPYGARAGAVPAIPPVRRARHVSSDRISRSRRGDPPEPRCLPWQRGCRGVTPPIDGKAGVKAVKFGVALTSTGRVDAYLVARGSHKTTAVYVGVLDRRALAWNYHGLRLPLRSAAPPFATSSAMAPSARSRGRAQVIATRSVHGTARPSLQAESNWPRPTRASSPSKRAACRAAEHLRVPHRRYRGGACAHREGLRVVAVRPAVLLPLPSPRVEATTPSGVPMASGMPTRSTRRRRLWAMVLVNLTAVA